MPYPIWWTFTHVLRHNDVIDTANDNLSDDINPRFTNNFAVEDFWYTSTFNENINERLVWLKKMKDVSMTSH